MTENKHEFDPSKLTDGHAKLFEHIARQAKRHYNQLEMLMDEACEVCGIEQGQGHPLEQALQDLIFSGYTAEEVIDHLKTPSESELEQ